MPTRRASSDSVRPGSTSWRWRKRSAQRRVLDVGLPELSEAATVGFLLEQPLHPAGGQAHLAGGVGDRRPLPSTRRTARRRRALHAGHGRSGCRSHHSHAAGASAGLGRGGRGWHRAPPLGGGSAQKNSGPGGSGDGLGSRGVALVVGLGRGRRRGGGWQTVRRWSRRGVDGAAPGRCWLGSCAIRAERAWPVSPARIAGPSSRLGGIASQGRSSRGSGGRCGPAAMRCDRAGATASRRSGDTAARCGAVRDEDVGLMATPTAITADECCDADHGRPA